MKVFTTITALRGELNAHKELTVGFVPTMGALHAGHISLVEKAAADSDLVVVSIFVNPTQFNDKNDLRNYPRTPEQDLRMVEEAGADIVFLPAESEIYPEPDSRKFDFGALDTVMEGATRPGHFNGVGQVVSKLFDIVRPSKAYFGQKDFQQVAVIRELVRQLGMDIEIIECPVVRESDGLAMSSRNALLDKEHRAAAPRIYAVLQSAVEMAGKMSVAELEKWVTQEIEKEPRLRVIYFQVVDALTLSRVQDWSEPGSKQGCIAVQAGAVRLIDNIRLKSE